MQKPSKIAMLLADDSGWRCRETLRRAVEKIVREALEDGWKAEDVAISLVEVADEQMDQIIGETLHPAAQPVVH